MNELSAARQGRGEYTVSGIFGDKQSAEAAAAQLLASGTPKECIAFSIGLTADPIAAEAPGQAYANQEQTTGAGIVAAASGVASLENEDTRAAKRLSNVERGTIALTVGPVDASRAAEARKAFEACGAMSIRSD